MTGLASGLADDCSAGGDQPMITYTLAAIGAGIVLVLGIPLMERLLRIIWPLTPKQEEAERLRKQARRSIDKFLR
jgi:hypothetical protein